MELDGTGQEGDEAEDDEPDGERADIVDEGGRGVGDGEGVDDGAEDGGEEWEKTTVDGGGEEGDGYVDALSQSGVAEELEDRDGAGVVGVVGGR